MTSVEKPVKADAVKVDWSSHVCCVDYPNTLPHEKTPRQGRRSTLHIREHSQIPDGHPLPTGRRGS
jgi:hypothetical protein